LAIVVGEGLACADFFEEVIHPGDGDVGVVFLDLFAVAIVDIASG
jgi:phosphotransferase system IIA component